MNSQDAEISFKESVKKSQLKISIKVWTIDASTSAKTIRNSTVLPDGRRKLNSEKEKWPINKKEKHPCYKSKTESPCNTVATMY